MTISHAGVVDQMIRGEGDLPEAPPPEPAEDTQRRRSLSMIKIKIAELLEEKTRLEQENKSSETRVLLEFLSRLRDTKNKVGALLDARPSHA